VLCVAGKQGEELSMISIRGQRSSFLQEGFESAVFYGQQKLVLARILCRQHNKGEKMRC